MVCIVYICDLSSYLYDGHHIIGDNGSGKNVPAHLCELGVVQRHRHHLGDVLFLFIFIFFTSGKWQMLAFIVTLGLCCRKRSCLQVSTHN